MASMQELESSETRLQEILTSFRTAVTVDNMPENNAGKEISSNKWLGTNKKLGDNNSDSTYYF